MLISSMQMYVSVRSSSKLEGLLDAQRGRNCTQGMLVSSIQELKRILLLTSNSQVDLDELARIKRSLQTVFSCISDSISALQSTGKHSNDSLGCYGMLSPSERRQDPRSYQLPQQDPDRGTESDRDAPLHSAAPSTAEVRRDSGTDTGTGTAAV